MVENNRKTYSTAFIFRKQVKIGKRKYWYEDVNINRYKGPSAKAVKQDIKKNYGKVRYLKFKKVR